MRRVLLVLAIVLVLLPVAGLALAAAAPTEWWPATLARHWAVHLVLLSLPAWCWFGRRVVPGILFGALAGLALWPWWLAATAIRAEPPGGHAATAVVANLYHATPDHGPAIATLDGDVVHLIETHRADRDRLRGDPRWPHQRWLVPPPPRGGMALLSRWPMVAEERTFAGAPAIDARIEMPWGPLRVVAMHTVNPVRRAGAVRNSQQLDELAGLAETEPGAMLVLGDLNATPADPGLRHLRISGLRPPPGRAPATWPSWLGPAGIAIDHALGLRVRLGPAAPIDLAGSDHRGLRVAFGLE